MIGKELTAEECLQLDELKNAILELANIRSFKELDGREEQKVVYKGLYCYYARRIGVTLPSIGKAINIKHPTVVYHCQNHEDKKRFHPLYRYTNSQLEQLCRDKDYSFIDFKK